MASSENRFKKRIIISSSQGSTLEGYETQDQNCSLVNVRTTIIHQDQDQGDKSLALTREVNLATPSSAPSAEEIRESGSAFQSLMIWGKKLHINISICNGDLICAPILYMLPLFPLVDKHKDFVSGSQGCD